MYADKYTESTRPKNFDLEKNLFSLIYDIASQLPISNNI
jgi:hypothetical protein